MEHYKRTRLLIIWAVLFLMVIINPIFDVWFITASRYIIMIIYVLEHDDPIEHT